MTRVQVCVVASLVSAWLAPVGAARAAELPVEHAKAVSVKAGSRGVIFRFSKKLDLTVAALVRPGRNIEIGCTRLSPAKLDGSRGSYGYSKRVRVREHRPPLRLAFPGKRPSFCTLHLVSTGIDIVDIPVTQDGAVYVDERHTLHVLRNAVFSAADNAQTARSPTFETADSFVGKYGSYGEMVVLPAPDATPPPGPIGIYSDGAHHFAAVGVTALGRRMFYDVNGEVMTTNGTTYLNDPDGV